MSQYGVSLDFDWEFCPFQLCRGRHGPERQILRAGGAHAGSHGRRRKNGIVHQGHVALPTQKDRRFFCWTREIRTRRTFCWLDQSQSSAGSISTRPENVPSTGRAGISEKTARSPPTPSRRRGRFRDRDKRAQSSRRFPGRSGDIFEGWASRHTYMPFAQHRAQLEGPRTLRRDGLLPVAARDFNSRGSRSCAWRSATASPTCTRRHGRYRPEWRRRASEIGCSRRKASIKAVLGKRVQAFAKMGQAGRSDYVRLHHRRRGLMGSAMSVPPADNGHEWFVGIAAGRVTFFMCAKRRNPKMKRRLPDGIGAIRSIKSKCNGRRACTSRRVEASGVDGLPRQCCP